MRNVIFFVVLAILTIAALVGWNAVRQQTTSSELTQVQPTETSEPTPELGTAVGRTSGLGSLNNPSSTGSGGFSNVTKGNSDPNAGVIPTATPQSQQVQGTPSPTVTPYPTTVPPQQTGTVVTYTDTGFSPKSITVKSGTMVKFINQSSKRMWVESIDVGEAKKLSGFDMGMSVGKNGFYEYTFSSTGSWGYQDKSNTSANATVIVN